MSLIPSFFGNRRSNVFDPISLDIWDPFEGFPSPPPSPISLLRPRNHSHRQRPHRLERDAGSPCVQGGCSWVEERRS
ncbi:UNVERIFIED_CONTAM: class I heat shock protein [Sesamum radiatum]|uniref:Class I heat shock protein n=1 Tax=Sesamum radiatum TaxID=300843 RepID=A0AAW2S7D1_SESRA